MSMTIILICSLKTFVISEFDCCRPSFVESMFDSVLKFCYLMIGTNHDKELFRHMGLQLCKLPRNTFFTQLFALTTTLLCLTTMFFVLNFISLLIFLVNDQSVLLVWLFGRRFASDTNVIRYAKIAMQLENKTVRDVALRCRWMSVCFTILISL